MKTYSVVTLVALAVVFALPSIGQEQSSLDPQVRQQIEALNRAYDEAFNQNDAEAISDLFASDAVETGPEEAAAGQQAIEDRYKVVFESHPNGHTSKLIQAYSVGDRVCGIIEWSMMQKKHTTQPMLLKECYAVTMYVREGDSWKISLYYWYYR